MSISIYVIECDPHAMFHVYVQVKELYQGVLEKLQVLHPCLITEEKMGEDYERMRREVEREVVRRKTLGSQLRTLLDTQLQVYMLFLSEYLLLSLSKNVKLSLKTNKSLPVTRAETDKQKEKVFCVLF